MNFGFGDEQRSFPVPYHLHTRQVIPRTGPRGFHSIMQLVAVWMAHKMTSLTNINVKLVNKTNMTSHNDSNRWLY
jgi:hypothetical protein